jgi:hypothetical protein
MLQFYPPYKNLDPRFLGKKEGRVTTVFNDLHELTKIFSVEEIDMLHHDKLNSSFRIFIPTVLMKRGELLLIP